MKINLQNIHSPCEQCLGSHYDGMCEKCEYNIAIVILKEVLKKNDYCNLCGNVEHIKGGYTDCKLGFNHSSCCNSYLTDWKEIVDVYDLNELIKTD